MPSCSSSVVSLCLPERKPFLFLPFPHAFAFCACCCPSIPPGPRLKIFLAYPILIFVREYFPLYLSASKFGFVIVCCLPPFSNVYSSENIHSQLWCHIRNNWRWKRIPPIDIFILTSEQSWTKRMINEHTFSFSSHAKMVSLNKAKKHNVRVKNVGAFNTKKTWLVDQGKILVLLIMTMIIAITRRSTKYSATYVYYWLPLPLFLLSCSACSFQYSNSYNRCNFCKKYIIISTTYRIYVHIFVIILRNIHFERKYDGSLDGRGGGIGVSMAFSQFF